MSETRTWFFSFRMHVPLKQSRHSNVSAGNVGSETPREELAQI
jgi:hypothetical protein